MHVIIVVVLFFISIIAIMVSLEIESLKGLIVSLIVLVVLIVGIPLTSSDTRLVDQNEYTLIDLSDATRSEYERPAYLLGSASSDNQNRCYRFWYYDENEYSNSMSISLSVIDFNFEANGNSVIVQTYETTYKYFRIIPLAPTSQSNKYIFVIPDNSIVETYGTNNTTE